MKELIHIHPNDNVAVAISTLEPGVTVSIDGATVTLAETIPAGHKVALSALDEGADIIKYGFPIGHTLEAIPAGGLVNEKNIKTNLDGVLDYTWNPVDAPKLPTKASPERTFQGYERGNGEVGIRNEIWIIPTVGCVNGIVNKLAEQLRSETQCKNVDAIIAYPHNYGCSQLGEDHENTRKILANMVHHPNAGAVFVVGLGCENNQIDAFRELIGEVDENRVRFMETQKVDDELETGMQILRELYDITSQDTRVDVPMSKLKVGLKCGGSDGFSGITANPLLGRFSDYLVAQGGTTVLTEVPEMFGAETLLMNRCPSKELFDKTVHLINDFKEYFISNNQPVYENPSPGNKAGGISTLEDKSLGCTQKSGNSLVRDVLPYGARLTTPGLNLLSSPGNDLVASTALATAGCHIVLFTTGRGTPFGTCVPTMKISTNSTLAEKKSNWIDFNAGRLLEDIDADIVLNDFIQYILDVASGELVHNEKRSYQEIAIFKTGVTL